MSAHKPIICFLYCRGSNQRPNGFDHHRYLLLTGHATRSAMSDKSSRSDGERHCFQLRWCHHQRWIISFRSPHNLHRHHCPRGDCLLHRAHGLRLRIRIHSIAPSLEKSCWCGLNRGVVSTQAHKPRLVTATCVRVGCCRPFNTEDFPLRCAMPVWKV